MKRTAFKKEIQEISKMSELPEHMRDIIVQNKIMNKRIIILEAEIQEKNSIIQQLKEQLDSTVIEQTQNKLTIMRNIEDQIQQRTKEIKQKYFEKSMQMQGEIEGLRVQVKELKLQKQKSQQKTLFYIQKIDSFKQYIIDVIDEKDYLISELSFIINEQYEKLKSCSFCSKSGSEQCQQFHNKTQKSRKKVPYIAKNV